MVISFSGGSTAKSPIVLGTCYASWGKSSKSYQGCNYPTDFSDLM